MTSSLLHLACADLHPDCRASLWGTSTEELVLAYALHDVDGHATGTASLDVLLRSISRVDGVRQAQPLRPTASSASA